MNSFNGLIAEFPGISVDKFVGENLTSTAFFLSHCHRDHMVGLESLAFAERLSNSPGTKIFCSDGTASILLNNQRFDIPSVVLNRLVVLSFGTDFELFLPESDKPDEDVANRVIVRMLPANHCPGSCMFLFKSETKKVLYTGDCRIDERYLKLSSYFTNLPGTVTSLYLDTTFCHKNAESFVPRETAIQETCTRMEKFFKRFPGGIVLLISRAELGYEPVFEEIHRFFERKIHVCEYKYDLYIEMPTVRRCLTLDPMATNIHACGTVCKKTDFCRTAKSGGEQKPRLMITLCAQTFTFGENVGRARVKMSEIAGSALIREKIAYSMHCSLSELRQFVDFIRPSRIVPCVIPRGTNLPTVIRLLTTLLKKDGDQESSNAATFKCGTEFEVPDGNQLSMENDADLDPVATISDDIYVPPLPPGVFKKVRRT